MVNRTVCLATGTADHWSADRTSDQQWSAVILCLQCFHYNRPELPWSEVGFTYYFISFFSWTEVPAGQK